MNPNINISKLLKKRRKECNMRQHHIVEKIEGLQRATYGSYEEGRATPNIYLLIKIARVMGYTSLDKFLFDIGDIHQQHEVLGRYYAANEYEREVVDKILNIKL